MNITNNNLSSSHNSTSFGSVRVVGEKRKERTNTRQKTYVRGIRTLTDLQALCPVDISTVKELTIRKNIGGLKPGHYAIVEGKLLFQSVEETMTLVSDKKFLSQSSPALSSPSKPNAKEVFENQCKNKENKAPEENKAIKRKREELTCSNPEKNQESKKIKKIPLAEVQVKSKSEKKSQVRTRAVYHYWTSEQTQALMELYNVNKVAPDWERISKKLNMKCETEISSRKCRDKVRNTLNAQNAKPD